MFELPFAFSTPAVLLALAALPALWVLLRVTPPQPRRIDFPPLRLILDLVPKQETPARTPWWLLLLRLVIAGVVIITFQPGDYFRTGAVMLLFGSFAYALHAAIVKRHGGGIDFIEFFLWRLACTGAFLLLASGAQGTLVWPSSPAWVILLIAGTIDVVISRSLYYLSMRRLKISILTLVLTLSPAVTALWSFILFDARPSLQQIIGGVAVMAGVLIVTSQRRRT